MDLKETLHEIINSKKGDKLVFFKSKYKSQFERYPKLMDMACDSGIDKEAFLKRFDYYIDMKIMIDNQEITNDQADVQIGESLGKEYIPEGFK